jgi:NADPH-dependent 2,4-dienoyl-CoA reductase/sulfur reductase-like enzyme
LPKRTVIVGANSAGISNAIAARKTDAKAEITSTSEERYILYSHCGLPFFHK